MGNHLRNKFSKILKNPTDYKYKGEKCISNAKLLKHFIYYSLNSLLYFQSVPEINLICLGKRVGLTISFLHQILVTVEHEAE